LNPKRPLIIASRASRLAKVQSRWVGRALKQRHPGLDVQYHWVESKGDQLVDQPLVTQGGKGLFVSSVQQAVIKGQADLAVHSMKDLPAAGGPRSLTIPAVPVRADPRDCLIAREGQRSIEQLPDGAVVGTAGPRRIAQILRLRPDLKIELLRGNIETRLRKIHKGELSPGGIRYDATLMAVAGLQRNGLGHYAIYAIDPAEILPSAGQGALALECRASDHITIRRVLPLNSPMTATAVHLERQIVAEFGGDCRSPIAVLAQLDDEGQSCLVQARVLGPDGRVFVEVRRSGPIERADRIAKQLIKALERHGARQVLASSADK